MKANMKCIYKRLLLMTMVAAAGMSQEARADALLIDVGSNNGTPSGSAPWVDAGVSEDLSGAAGAQISGSGGVSLISGLTVSVSDNSSWNGGEYGASSWGNAMLDDYMIGDNAAGDGVVNISLGGFDNTMTSSMGGVDGSFALEPGSQYTLYLWGRGDSPAQNAKFTLGGVEQITTAESTAEGDHFVTYEITTPADLTGFTIDFSFQNDNDSRFSGWNGAALVSAAAADAPPAISGLTDQTVGVGANVTLEPSVTGAEPITYQWQENGFDLLGETNATLMLSSVQTSQSGDVYTLMAANAYGSDTESMTLSVTSVESFTLNVDLNNGSSYNYSGTAIAEDDGTVWNSLDVASSPSTLTIRNVKDSNGNTLSGVSVTIASQNGAGISKWSNDGLSTPNPLLLMRDYTFGNTYNVTVSGLPAGTYGFWYFGHGDQNDQAGTVSIDSANGGGSGSTANSAQGRDLFNGGEGISYASFSGKPVGSSGTFSFQVANFLNGFQLQLTAPPVVGGLNDQTVVAGNNLVLSPTISGVPAPLLQWKVDGAALPGETNATLTLNNVQYEQDGMEYSLVAENAAGSASDNMILSVIVTPVIEGLNNQAVEPGTDVTLSPVVSGVPAPALQWYCNDISLPGSTNDVLTISNAQESDSGTYSLVAGNAAGTVSNSMILTVSSVDVAPVVTGPSDQTVVEGNAATFSASASGLPLPTLQWQLNGTDIPGATNATLAVSDVQYAQDGDVYTFTASNAAGTDFGSATLTVLVPPAISQQPADVAVVVGGSATFSIEAGGVPAVSYQWYRDGSPVPGATDSIYTVSGVSGADNGAVFAVMVSNRVDAVISQSAELTALSAMSGTLLPADGSAGIAPDQPLRIEFSGGTAVLGSGMLYVRDAADGSVFASIDTSAFVTFVYDGATVTNGAIRSVQGKSCYYEPIAIDDNVAWITLNPDERFDYGKSYYVTFDDGLFKDSSGASFPGIADSSTWRFSTKASGLSTPSTSGGPTTISVGLDGDGDFATLQGASDWIPQHNSLHRTITIAPGTYRDYTLFEQDRDNVSIVGAGADREEVYLYYPYPTLTSGSAGTLTLECSDLNVRNLTLDTKAYETFPGRMRSLYTVGDRMVFHDVLIKGGQDTLYANAGSIYFKACEIWGSVDFIYGGALTVFDQCEIVQVRDSGGPITAPNTDLNAPYGEVFLNCTFPRALVANGYPYNVGVGTTTFQRPWGKDGMTAIINCQVGTHISTKGWGEGWNNETTARSREYGTTLIGGGSTATIAQRQAAGAYWLNTIDPDYVNDRSLSTTDPLVYPPNGPKNRVAVTVDPSDYTLDAMFGDSYYGLGSWRPSLAPMIIAQPVGQTIDSGEPVSFSVTATGIPEAAYQWKLDGVVLAGETNASLHIASVQLSDAGEYTVEVSNPAGTVVSDAVALDVVSFINTTPTNMVYSVSGSTLTFSWPADHTGWMLEAQTNCLGTNWFAVAGSTLTNEVVIQMFPGARSAFFRLKYP